MSPTKKIGITGATGLIGWHLRCYFHGRSDVEIVPAGRKTFDCDDEMDRFTSACDAIVHLAGMNRGDDDIVEKTNVELTEKLVASLERTKSAGHVLFSSSTHIEGDTPYGRSKRRSAEVLAAWAQRSRASFTNLILPHVFGEAGRPFYNSVVSTFCFQLAEGQSPQVHNDSELSLVHAQQVADIANRVIRERYTGQLTCKGSAVSVRALLRMLKDLSEVYEVGHTIPDIQDPLRLSLFNTYRSYLFPRRSRHELTLNTDPRGVLVEAVKSRNGGQTFFSSTKPGVTRGNHYHLRKVERFVVVRGQATIEVRRMFSDDVHTFDVDGCIPAYIDIPTLHTHNITNVGDADLLTLFWANEIFDLERSDTFGEPVRN